MTVKELIQKLQSMPQDAIVVAEGYEDGFDAVKEVRSIAVEENPQKKWYYGKYVESSKPDAEKVVLLFADTKANEK